MRSWVSDRDMRRSEGKVLTLPSLWTLFFSPMKEGKYHIVVLVGAAGIGKTMTSRKIMLDWEKEPFMHSLTMLST